MGKVNIKTMLVHQSKSVADVIELHRKQKFPMEVIHMGHKFIILPGVFSPFIAPSGHVGLLFPSLPNKFNGKRVLEIGCGSGVISCLMALSGAKQVVGVDINPQAIENAKQNAKILGVDSKINFRQGNLFEPVGQKENFDIIFADLPFTSGNPEDMLEAAFFDPDLKSIQSYIQQLPQWLESRERRAYLCFSNLDGQSLQDIATRVGLRWHPFLTINLGWIELYLIELSRKG